MGKFHPKGGSQGGFLKRKGGIIMGLIAMAILFFFRMRSPEYENHDADTHPTNNKPKPHKIKEIMPAFPARLKNDAIRSVDPCYKTGNDDHYRWVDFISVFKNAHAERITNDPKSAYPYSRVVWEGTGKIARYVLFDAQFARVMSNTGYWYNLGYVKSIYGKAGDYKKFAWMHQRNGGWYVQWFKN